MTRRTFLATSAALGLKQPGPLLCVFSKHLASVPVAELGGVARDLGFDGVDLTVRPKGHVLPEEVGTKLVPAVEGIRAAGLEVPMITTELLSTEDPAARPTLETAHRLGIPYFKPGYWKPEPLDSLRPKAKGLFFLALRERMTAGVHNHSGNYFGAVPYEYQMLLDGTTSDFAGYYFDPAHATIEGGLRGWRTYLEQALPRLKMIAIKDFVWEKNRVQWCPLGEGVVDWVAMFDAFNKSNFAGPISLHVEYETKDERASLAKDLEFLRRFVPKRA
jgi:sugar phosphate isomerase/epimerase